jgi:chaperonin cofactor prefoldin
MTNPNASPNGQPESKQQLVNQINILEKNLQQVTERRRSLEQSLQELESAADHLDDTENPMRLMGNLLVSQPKDKIESYVDSKRDEQQASLDNVEESEEKLRDQLDELKENFLDTDQSN